MRPRRNSSRSFRLEAKPLTEVFVNRLSQGRRFVGPPRRAVQVHHQGPGLVHPQITRPVDDEFLSSRVEIALTERRRIDRVEELSQLCDADLYDLAALRRVSPADDRGCGGTFPPRNKNSQS